MLRHAAGFRFDSVADMPPCHAKSATGQLRYAAADAAIADVYAMLLLLLFSG